MDDDLYRQVKEAFERHGQSPAADADRPVPQSGDAIARDRADSRRLSRSLGRDLDSLGLSEKQWLVLALRSGCSPHFTLQEVGEELGVTRERIRQIQKRACERLFGQFSRRLNYAMDVAETWATHIPFAADQADLSSILESIALSFEKAGWHEADAGATGKIILAIRSMTFDRPTGHKHLSGKWPKFWCFACMISPPVTDHPAVAEELKRQFEETRPLTYQEMLIEILREAGKPLHWRHIVHIAESMYKHRKETIVPGGLFNELGRHKETFVRTDHGTYGLREWGSSDAEYYADIAATVLSAKSKPMSYGELKAEIGSRRPISDSSLKMMLGMNPRFYEAQSGGYGLRVWLPPRERQSLLTPNWLIETRSSMRRLLIAERHGYDIESIVQRDNVESGLLRTTGFK